MELNEINDASNYVIKKNRFESRDRGEEALEVIDSLLDKGNVVFVNTLMKAVPYYKTYKKELNKDDVELADSHYFLIVDKDDERYYYLDNYLNHNKANFTPYEKNKSMGVANKAEFVQAFNYQFRCFTIDINAKELAKLPGRFHELFNAIIENYKGTDSKSDILSGRKVIEKYIEYCDSRAIKLDDAIPRRDHNVYSLSRTIFTRSTDRKRILLKILKEKDDSEESRLCLVHSLERNIASWELAINGITKRHFTKQYVLDRQLGQCFSNILETEDSLYDVMETELDYLCYTV
ncbi:hypothetical protein V3851_03870 [Paenibacillus sp. M1]|uniref:Uncharacterized protein n=1 Tax=Paenibacillus haidiansis TaxID=1574488 RepID=A0ABU7VMG0_9BACL